jgi:hypothetical protein
VLYTLSKDFLSTKIDEMVIDETPTYQHVEQLQITIWTFTKEEQL